jgi:hypothetical protein
MSTVECSCKAQIEQGPDRALELPIRPLGGLYAHRTDKHG